MNDPNGSTVNTKGKKIRSSAALALAVGLVWAFSGSVALAGEPIPGVDVELGKNPGGIPVSAPTGVDGAYQFKGLAPGKYDLSIAGQLVQTISVDKGTISGVLSREPGGKASITFNGQVGVVPDLPSAPVSTSRSNKKAGIAKGEAPPPDDVLPSAPVNTSRSNKKAGIAKGEEPTSDDEDVKPGIAEANSALGGRNAWDDTWKTAPPPGDYDGDGKPGIAGTPIQGTEIGLEGDPGSVKVSAKTDVNGAYQFTGLPAGKYKLILPDKSVKSITIGAGGTTRGKVMRSSNGSIGIWDDTDITHATAAKEGGAIAIGTKSPAGAALGKTIEIFDRWGTTGGISGGFGGGPSIPGGIGGAGAPGAGVRP